MGIIGWIILGGIAGWIASMIMKVNAEQGMLGNIIAGIIGGVLGGAILNLFNKNGVTGFNFWSLLVSVIGAVIVLAIKGAITGKRSM